jgi:PAS domain S-box-containing protein
MRSTNHNNGIWSRVEGVWRGWSARASALSGSLPLRRWQRRFGGLAVARPNTINRQRLVDTLRSIGDGVIATDLRGRVTMMNSSASRLTAWQERDALEHAIDTVLRIVDERTRSICRIPTDTVLAECSCAPLPEFGVLVARDGRDIPISGSVAPVRRGDGTIQGLVFSFRDVTESRCTERVRNALLERERSARRDAEAMSHSKDDFVAVISHELRTPLAAIYGWIRLLQRGSLDPAGQARALDVIERNTRLQTQLIDDLLDMSRAIRGSLRLDIRVVDLPTVLHAALEAVRPAAQGKQLRFETDIKSGIVVCGDSARLQQTFCNLLGNAIKFTPEGGSIAIELKQNGPHAVVRLRDSGVGIPADVLPRIFEPFEQGRELPSTAGGLGIGLALVRHLIGLHRGTISAASPGAGQGTTFTIHLPTLARVEDTATIEGGPAPVAPRGTAVAP